MSKLALFPLLLAVTCVVAGLYGAVHDQLSYTVSQDYFHALKFPQFGIPSELHSRAGVALVGWSASWWMGLLIGVPVFTAGLFLPGWRAYLTRSLVAVGVVVGTALAVGLAGLAYACMTITEPARSLERYPVGVTDRVGFDRVGVMHNFSYLGGFLGIVTGSVYLAVARARLNDRGTATSPPT